MITIDKLNEYGVNTKEGIERCLGKEDFYIRLVNRLLNDDIFIKLKEEIEIKNFDEAFKLSHSLKGTLGNLAITPMYEIIYRVTELLRLKKDIDYKQDIDKLLSIRNDLLELIKE